MRSLLVVRCGRRRLKSFAPPPPPPPLPLGFINRLSRSDDDESGVVVGFWLDEKDRLGVGGRLRLPDLGEGRLAFRIMPLPPPLMNLLS